MNSGYVSAAERPLILRIVDFPLVAMIVAVLLFLLASALAVVLGKFVPAIGTTATAAVQAVITIGLVFVSYKFAISRLGEEPRDDLPTGDAPRQLGIGLLVGALLFSAVVAVAAALGVYRVTGWGYLAGVLPILIGSALVPAFAEEVLFRGILFRWIEDFAGTWAALAISSAFFGAAHLLNPGANWFSAVAIAIEAGLLLGGAYMLTRSLWMPIGLHAAWNFTQGGIFGVPISGHASAGLIRAELQGPAVLSGSGFGLEASVIAIVIASAAGVWLVKRAARGGLLVEPWWERRRLGAGD